MDEGRAEGPAGASLGELARLLREVDHLEPDVRRKLADLVDELEATVHGELDAERAGHVRESVRHLVHAIRAQREEDPVGQAREQLEATVARTAAEAPVATGVARRLIEMLADLGI
jgi:hypothetical protein